MSSPKIPMGPCDYSSPVVPNDYVCSGEGCGRRGVKLWRLYNTFLDHQRLLCAECACDREGVANEVDAEGKLPDRRTNQIGALIPAVPTEDGSTFCGYSSVPEIAVRWWKGIPT